MDKQQKEIVTWVLIIGGAAIVINKFKTSLFGSSFNPNDTSVISTVWNDTTDNHFYKPLVYGYYQQQRKVTAV